MDMYKKRELRKNKKIEGNNSTDEKFNKIHLSWYPGHMAKTKRLIQEKINLIDIVYELIDSRLPHSSKIKEIDSIIKNKLRLLIMTKIDLCDMNETSKWIKYYEKKDYKVILANLNNGNDFKKIINATHELTKELQEKRLTKGLNAKEIHALVIGIPNVGKSTLINKMASKKVANVANRPGITQNLVWLKTNSNILLLDTPGILSPKLNDSETALNLASMTAIKEDILPLDDVAIHILHKLNDYYPKILEERYKVTSINKENITETYDNIGRSKGCLISKAEVDYDRVSQLIINDVKKEYIKGITFDRIKSEEND